MWHRISEYSLNSMRRILNNVQPTLHSMAIDLTSAMTRMPLTGLVEVGYGVNRRDSPCLCLLVNHTQSGWKQLQQLLHSNCLVLSLERIHLLFSSCCCRCVCCLSITPALHTQRQSRWSHISNSTRSSYLMLIRWHQWGRITKWVQETTLVLQHVACVRWQHHNMFHLSE